MSASFSYQNSELNSSIARQVSSDVRNYEIHRLMSMGMRSLVHHLYPRLLALHDLDDRIALPREETLPDGTVITRISYPSCTRDSHFFMEPAGVYMVGKMEPYMLNFANELIYPPVRQ